jgi:glutamate dehydrogenase (NAD(P)+)
VNDEVLICRVEPDSGPEGWVVVDSTVAGRSTGGLRMLPDLTEAELRLLARAMTLKFGLLGLPQGGAKAGVRFDPEAPEPERLACLQRFALAIRPLLRSRWYLPLEDMGTDNATIRRVLSQVGAPLRYRDLRGRRSGYWTACGVFAAACEACRLRGWQIRGCTIAVEGFGKVGSALAEMFARAGARVIAVSTSRGALHSERGLDIRRLAQLARHSGSAIVELYPDAERLPRERLLEVDADVLAPCARHHSVHAGNAAQVRARVIVPGANAPLTPEAESRLEARDVLCVPDFLANAGGVLGGTMEFAGMPDRLIQGMLSDTLARLTRWALREAASCGLTPRQFAEAAALARHAEIRKQAERPGLGSRLFAAALALYRRGLIPAVLVGRLAPLYFARLARAQPLGRTDGSAGENRY